MYLCRFWPWKRCLLPPAECVLFADCPKVRIPRRIKI